MTSRLPFYLSIAAATIGVILLILTGILGWVVIPNIIDDKVEEETRLEVGNDVWEKWVDIPIPIYQSFYFFSLTNLGDYADVAGVNLSAVVPRFEEVGPFVFREIRNKTVIDFTDHDTVLYTQHTRYIFDQEMSGPGLTLNTTVNILNIPLLTVLTLNDVHPQTYPTSEAVLGSLLGNGESLFMKDVPVGEVLYTGYNFKEHNQEIYATVAGLAEQLGIPLPDELKDGEFAFFRGKNNTDEGVWEVYRGRDSSSLFSVIRMMNSNYTGPKYELGDWWKDECGMINGTDGTMFPPFVKKDRRLEIFVPEICRSIYLKYDSEVKFEDIPGYRFTLPDELFASPYDPATKAVDPGHPNACFCERYMEPLEDDGCRLKGVVKLRTCKAQVPMVMSKPHFLDGDEELIDLGRRSGLSPVRGEHDSFIDVEPYTGFPLRLHVRIQVGAEVQPYRTITHIPPYNTIPHTYYPVFWVDKHAELDEELIDEIKDKLMKPLKQVNIGRWSLIGIGAAFVIVGAGLVFKFRPK